MVAASPAMLLIIVLAIAVPSAFLYAVHWLDLYGSERPRTVLLCFAWGLIAFLLSFAVNRFCIDVLGFTRAQVGTRSAPLVEEVFKALVLFHLLRRGKLTYFVDGAIYGFASGIGFAVIENLRYVQLFPDNPLAVVVVRDFSSALAHGTATALTGIALGHLAPSLHGRLRVGQALVCLLSGVALHYAWNNTAFFSPLGARTTEWLLVGVGLAGLAAVAATILAGLRRERQELHEALGPALGVSRGEAAIVQHLDEVDHLLAPIEKRFGRGKRHEVARFLHAEARLGLLEDRVRVMQDPALRDAIAAELPSVRTEVDRERRNVGVYVMMYVRSIFPETQWSLWARAQEDARALRRTGFDLWAALARALIATQGRPSGISLADLAQRGVTAEANSSGHASALPEAMQHCLHCIRHEVAMTLVQVAGRVKHHEQHVAAMVEELVARGLVVRDHRDGQMVFSARTPHEPSRAHHLWRALAARNPHREDQS